MCCFVWFYVVSVGKTKACLFAKSHGDVGLAAASKDDDANDDVIHACCSISRVNITCKYHEYMVMVHMNSMLYVSRVVLVDMII